MSEVSQEEIQVPAGYKNIEIGIEGTDKVFSLVVSDTQAYAAMDAIRNNRAIDIVVADAAVVIKAGDAKYVVVK